MICLRIKVYRHSLLRWSLPAGNYFVVRLIFFPVSAFLSEAIFFNFHLNYNCCEPGQLIFLIIKNFELFFH